LLELLSVTVALRAKFFSPQRTREAEVSQRAFDFLLLNFDFFTQRHGGAEGFDFLLLTFFAS
jgi:hypothetical protein